MKLKKLTLTNFKGLKNFTFEPNGESADVMGANESGKTTLFDALTFLLTGKDSRDRSPDSFGIKTREHGEVVHGLDHTVEGEFDCFTLKKVYQEKWTRKRGAVKEEFSGHTTEYFIDGVPVKASEYQAKVEEVMPEQLLKILTMPDYFPEQMHWTDRRKVLFDLAGDIDQDDIINGYSGLERYPEVLGNRTHEAQEKVLKARKRDLNKELDNIPSRIDELNRRIYNEIGNVDEANEQIEGLKAKKDTIEGKRSEVKSGGTVAKLNVEKGKLEAEKQNLKNEHRQSVEDSLKDARGKVSDLQDKVDEAETDFRVAKRMVEQKESNAEKIRSEKNNIGKGIEEVKGKEPKLASDFGPDICPVCERPMEDGEEHDYEAYLKEFNEKKAGNIKSLKEKWVDVEAKLKEAESVLTEFAKKAVNIQGKLNQRKQALETAQNKLKAQKEHHPAFDSSAIDEQIQAIDEKITNHRQEKQSQLEQLDSLIKELDSQIEQHQSTIHQANENQRTRKRIAELQEERKEVAKQLEETEADLHLMEEFVRARSAFVTDKVNEKFEHVSWKLFDEQINGGLQECCEAVFKGVPFSEGLNNAGRIQAGLDIIHTLSKHYGKSAPVFVDNAEGISDIPGYDLQVIAMYVSPAHKELTVAPKEELLTA